MSVKDKEQPDQYESADPTSVTNPENLESSIVEAKDPKRRKLLVGGAAVVGGLGAVALAAPMIASMSPSARAQAAGAPAEADISKLSPGQLLTVEWRGKPVWIVNRTEEALELLEEDTARLRDPASEESLQPEYATNPSRAVKPEYFVVIGVCTHLGCSPTYRPEIGAADLGSDGRNDLILARPLANGLAVFTNFRALGNITQAIKVGISAALNRQQGLPFDMVLFNVFF